MALSGKYRLIAFFLTLFTGAMILGPVLDLGLASVWPLPFHREMDRALMISAVASLAMFWSHIPLGKFWLWNGDAWKQLLLGYFIAAVSIQAMLGAYLAVVGFTSTHPGGDEIARRVVLALVAALLVPPLEETIFRGFVQRELIERLGWRAGWVIAALIYMLAHFMKIPGDLDQQPIHPLSGVYAIGAAFVNLWERMGSDGNPGKAVNLFLIGLILGGVFQRSGTLWLNAGLHSGWIFGLLLFTGLASPIGTRDRANGSMSMTPVWEPPPFLSWSWYGTDILSSFTTTVVLVLLGLWLWRFYRHPSILPETGENAP